MSTNHKWTATANTAGTPRRCLHCGVEADSSWAALPCIGKQIEQPPAVEKLITDNFTELCAPSPTPEEEAPRALTDEEIRIRIAEWCGYENVAQENGKLFGHIRGDSGWLEWNEIPNFCTSLDAIASAEARLTDTQHNAYRLQIIHTLAEDQGVPWSDIYGNGRVWFSAPSRIRALALLRTISPKLP